MKMMFSILADCGLVLEKHIENNINNDEGTDIKEILGEIAISILW